MLPPREKPVLDFPNEEKYGCMLCTMGEGVERDSGAFDG